MSRAEAGSGVPAAAPGRRAERDDDAPFLLRLFGDAQGAVLAGLDPTLRDMLMRQQRAGQAMTYRARYPEARFEIVEADDTPIGRIVTDLGPDMLTLVDIALVPPARNRGIGTALLRATIDEADAAGVPVRLQVLASNIGALRLYQRFGFVVAARSAADMTLERASSSRAGADPG